MCTSKSLCFRSSLLHDTIGRFVCPELKVSSSLSRLIDLPNHPWYFETIENVNVLADNSRLVRTCGTELFEENKLIGRFGVLKRDGRFVAELINAVVGVDVDKIKRRAVPVLGDI